MVSGVGRCTNKGMSAGETRHKQSGNTFCAGSAPTRGEELARKRDSGTEVRRPCGGEDPRADHQACAPRLGRPASGASHCQTRIPEGTTRGRAAEAAFVGGGESIRFQPQPRPQAAVPEAQPLPAARARGATRTAHFRASYPPAPHRVLANQGRRLSGAGPARTQKAGSPRRLCRCNHDYPRPRAAPRADGDAPAAWRTGAWAGEGPDAAPRPHPRLSNGVKG